MKPNELNLSESSDFACLLELMYVLEDEPRYACLPELFSILGHEKLLLLAKYAGGSEIKIPTIEELNDSIEALQWYYDINIAKKKKLVHSPFRLRPMILEIEKRFNGVS